MREKIFKYTVAEDENETMVWHYKDGCIATVDDKWIFLFKEFEHKLQEEEWMIYLILCIIAIDLAIIAYKLDKLEK